MADLTITIAHSSITPDIKRHLSIIGKRAQKVNGESMFSDITTSTNEDSVFTDFINAGAHNLVASITDITFSSTDADATKAADAGTTTPTPPSTVSFTIKDVRWGSNSLTLFLQDAIRLYLYNYALAQYLSVIRPSTGEKYPPLYGQTYINQCAVIMQNIRSLAFHKRPETSPASLSYENLKVTTGEKEEDKKEESEETPTEEPKTE